MGGFRLVRIGSPYNSAELAELDYEQSADVMYLAHIDHAPTKLVRQSHTSWAFQTVTFGPSIAAPTGLGVTVTNPNQDADATPPGNAYFPQLARYAVTAVDDETGQESRASAIASGTNDLTLKRNKNSLAWTAVTGADRYRVYKADNQQSLGYIGTTTGLTFTDDNIGPDLSDGPPVGDNPFSGAGDYPSTVTFFEQRLMWGRTRNKSNGIWGSKSADYENMDISRPLKDNDALSFALVGQKVNAVNHLVPMTDLLALASDSVFRISGGSDGGYITATQIVSRRQVGRGCSRLNPVVVDNVVFYQTSVGGAVRALGYTFEIDGYKTDDVTIFSPHLFRDFNIVSWAYAQEPRSIIWAVRDDGQLLCFTWEQEQEVWGWTHCYLPGASVKSVCVLSEGGEDRLYLIVERTIGGVARYFIERMASAYWDEIDDSCYLDAAVTYRPETPQTEFGNLHHLEGETVAALADGNVVEGLVVANGKVTLPDPAERVTIGLPYDALIETLPLAIQTKSGWTLARRSTVGEVVAKVIDTRGLWAGPDENSLFEIRPRQNEAFGEPNALKTGDMEIDVQATTSGECRIVLKSTQPLPFTITAVGMDPLIGA